MKTYYLLLIFLLSSISNYSKDGRLTFNGIIQSSGQVTLGLQDILTHKSYWIGQGAPDNPNAPRVLGLNLNNNTVTVEYLGERLILSLEKGYMAEANKFNLPPEFSEIPLPAPFDFHLVPKRVKSS